MLFNKGGKKMNKTLKSLLRFLEEMTEYRAENLMKMNEPFLVHEYLNSLPKPAVTPKKPLKRLEALMVKQ
jgi:hypothetical protein